MKSEIKTQNISTKKLKFVAEIFLADLRYYNNIIDSNYVSLANPLEKNQVWTFRTSANKFGKILIKDVKAFVKDTENYAETTFLWEYQPDGSMVFK